MYEQTGVREGMARVIFTGSKIQFIDLPVMGRSPGGGMINRAIYADDSVPEWFIKSCKMLADKDNRVRIKIKQLKGTTTATAVPCADTEEEFMAQCRVVRKNNSSEIDHEYAILAHEIYAGQNGLDIIEHLCDSKKVHTRAVVKSTGRQVIICRGVVVSRLKNYIQSGKAKLEDVVAMYVRISDIIH